jgi:hypothetical protein
MKPIKPAVLKLAFALSFSAASMGYAANASANAIFETISSFSLTLTDVSTEAGLTGRDGDWAVYGEEYFIDSGVFTSGDGTANNYYGGSFIDMAIGDSVTQTTAATGGAGLGIGEAYAMSGLDLNIENYASNNLVFTFDYAYLITSAVGTDTGVAGDDAYAIASLDVLDDLFSVDLLEEVTADLLYGPLSDQLAYSGSFSFMLSPGDYNFLSAYSSADGTAVGAAMGAASVPEPSTLMLMSLSILGFGATRLRKKS